MPARLRAAGVTGVAVTGELGRLLLSGGGNDGIGLAVKVHAHGR
jgi:hypothetical protein